MSEQLLHTENEPHAGESIELIDCGRASERTCGFPFLLYFELGDPPFDGTLIL